MEDYDKSKESSYLKYLDISNLYEWAMSQKLPVNNFTWIQDTSQFYEDFIKSILKKVMKDIFFKLVVQYPETLHKVHNDFPFLPEIMKIN